MLKGKDLTDNKISKSAVSLVAQVLSLLDISLRDRINGELLKELKNSCRKAIYAEEKKLLHEFSFFYVVEAGDEIILGKEKNNERG